MQAAEGLHAAGGRELQAKLKELVRHIRENKLRMTFTDALGQAQSQPDGVSNQKEARRLAFYLFWNVCTDYDRQVALKQSPMGSQHKHPPCQKSATSRATLPDSVLRANGNWLWQQRI